MGHHHRKQKSYSRSNQPREQQLASSPDFGSMLKGLNLGDIDMSKVDMNKVQSILDNLKSANGPGALPVDSAVGGNTSISPNQRMDMLNALKEVVPDKKSRKLEKLIRFLQLANSMNSHAYDDYSRQDQEHRKRHRR